MSMKLHSTTPYMSIVAEIYVGRVPICPHPMESADLRSTYPSNLLSETPKTYLPDRRCAGCEWVPREYAISPIDKPIVIARVYTRAYIGRKFQPPHNRISNRPAHVPSSCPPVVGQPTNASVEQPQPLTSLLLAHFPSPSPGPERNQNGHYT